MTGDRDSTPPEGIGDESGSTDGSRSTGGGGTARADGAPPRGETDLGDLFDELEELEELVDSEHEREQVRDAMRAASDAQDTAVFGRVIWGFDRSDLAEAALGSLLFGIPMAVEGGTLEAGEFLAANPPFLAGTFAATVGIVVGILYVADIQDVRVADPFFGVVPRRLVGVLATAAVTSVVLLSAWGFLAGMAPVQAVATCVVAMVPMSIGAALGDILPGN